MLTEANVDCCYFGNVRALTLLAQQHIPTSFEYMERNMLFLSMPLQMDFSSKGKTEKDEGMRVRNDGMEGLSLSFPLSGKK